MMKAHSAILVAAAGAALLMVGGCTSPVATISPSASAGTVATPVPSAPDALPTPAAPPADYTMVTAAANKIHVPLPSDLQVADPSQIDISPEMQQNFADMAQKLGMTVDALQQQIGSLDLYAMDGDTNNVNIMQPLPGVGTTLADVQPSLENIGATGIASRDATAPTGPALVVAYTLTNNDVTMNGAQLYVQTDTMTTTVITITGVTWTADQVSQMADVMVAGIQHV